MRNLTLGLLSFFAAQSAGAAVIHYTAGGFIQTASGPGVSIGQYKEISFDYNGTWTVTSPISQGCSSNSIPDAISFTCSPSPPAFLFVGTNISFVDSTGSFPPDSTTPINFIADSTFTVTQYSGPRGIPAPYFYIAALDHLTITDDSGTKTLYAVPEPTTWAMMLLGFGAIGATARQSRRFRKIPALAEGAKI
jgi:hypothetical protein